MIRFFKDLLGINKYTVERYDRKLGWEPVSFYSMTHRYAKQHIKRLHEGWPNDLYRIAVFNPNWLDEKWAKYDAEEARIRDDVDG